LFKKMSNRFREDIGEEMKSHMPAQEQALANKMGNAWNAFRNVLLMMLTQLFDQFMVKT
ncbi:hypothetical protein J1N35_007682, partial [Gossypium stocksii]